MSGRPNWYSDHPPACTCAMCQGGGRRRRRRRSGQSSTHHDRRTRQQRPSGQRGGTPPESHQAPSRRDRRGRGGCALVWLAMFSALIGGAIVVLANQDMRTEITSLVSSQFSTPTPVPAVILAADTPTPTAILTLPAPTPIPLIPASTPTPEHTPSPTAEPTATATPSPTPSPSKYAIDDVDVKLVTNAGGITIADLSVAVRNVTAGDGHPPIQLLMSIDGGEAELVTIISGLTAGEAELFVFSREFSPGRYTLTLTAGDALSEVSIDVAPATVALVVPTSTPTETLTPEPTETPVSTATLMPAPIATRTPVPSVRVPNLMSTPWPTPTPWPSWTPTPTLTPTGTPVADPSRRHLEEKRYMLQLINIERTNAGLHPVILGDNVAAQLHAEESLSGCFSSHWGLDGLKPYMRYSLAGGYQSNGENGSGSDYCVTVSDGYRAIRDIRQEIREAMEGWMESPGHRSNILRPKHRKVNVGIAWDRYNFVAYQHFEGDYVGYDQVPLIQDGILTMTGTLKNGAGFAEKRDLGVQIYYDPPPHKLTRGQVSRTYCSDSGLNIASLREPLPAGWSWNEDTFTVEASHCPDPYDVPADAPAPRSLDEAHEFWQVAYNASQLRSSTTSIAPWITATEWDVDSDSFSVVADLNDLVKVHGDGVYSVMIWAVISGERTVVSQYSIFHGVTPPDTYSVGAGGG